MIVLQCAATMVRRLMTTGDTGCLGECSEHHGLLHAVLSPRLCPAKLGERSPFCTLNSLMLDMRNYCMNSTFERLQGEARQLYLRSGPGVPL